MIALAAIVVALAVFIVKPGTRTAADIVAAVRDIDPQHNAQLQRGAAPAPPGGTWCNKFIAWVTSSLGSPVPFGEYGTHAYDQISWLAAGNDGWRQGDEAEARANAARGGLSLATNVSSAVPGGAHLALVLPNAEETRIAQAGAHCYNDAPLAAGFGGLPVTYYLHD